MDTEYTIAVVDKVGDHEHGVTYAQDCRIELEAGMAPERHRWTLIHELAHAVWQETGMGHEMMKACGTDKADLLEEDIIRRFVPALLATLKNAGVK